MKSLKQFDINNSMPEERIYTVVANTKNEEAQIAVKTVYNGTRIRYYTVSAEENIEVVKKFNIT